MTRHKSKTGEHESGPSVTGWVGKAKEQKPRKPREEKLKPCPFCGTGAVMLNGYSDEHWVSCFGGCGAIGPDGGSPDAAVKAWNTRPGKTP